MFLRIFRRQYSSALYITGNKASETFSLLTPHIDFDERLQDKRELINNIKLRHLDVHLDEVIRLWNFYKHMEMKKRDLEDSKISISKTIINLGKKGSKYEAKINTLKAHGKMVKEDLRVFKEKFWEVEEKAACEALKIPNLIHEKTPKNEEIVYLYGTRTNTIQDEHEHENEHEPHKLLYMNNYLTKKAAIFELSGSFYFSDQLLSNNFIQFCNSDLARSAITEGVGMETDSVLMINPDLHLIGGASLTSFMAYYCKHTVFPSQLPLKFFALGRKYVPPLNQETAVHLFIATEDMKSMNVEFERTLQDVIRIYESLDVHFRVCLQPAHMLYKWESLRASFQMFSPTFMDYVEVGNISLCGDYVSKRLLFNYGKGINVNYPCIISGTVFSAPKLLDCGVDQLSSVFNTIQ